MGTGTIADPYTLAFALSASSPIGAGDTIYLRGGTYTGDFVCVKFGTEAYPIIVKPYNNERVIFTGTLTTGGAHVHWYDIEKRYTGGTRETIEEGSHPAISAGVTSNVGSGIKFINCIIYDQVDNGIESYAAASGDELYGCVIFNNGWLGPDRGHGHGLYTHNSTGNAVKTIKHCIFGPSFASASGAANLAQFATGGDACKHYRFIESVFISGAQLIGGGGVNDVVMDGCHIHKDNLQIGYHDNLNVNATVSNCRILGTFHPSYMPAFTFTNNLVARLEVDDDGMFVTGTESVPAYYTMSGNRYHYLGGHATPFQLNYPYGWLNFVQWQTLHNDASTWSTSAPGAAEDSTHVYANQYDVDRGLIVVWNWTEADSVTVDVSTVLAAGDDYTLRQATDYFGDVGTGTVAQDGTITIDMRAISHSVSIPDGWDVPLIATTFPRFGTFQIDKS